MLDPIMAIMLASQLTEAHRADQTQRRNDSMLEVLQCFCRRTNSPVRWEYGSGSDRVLQELREHRRVRMNTGKASRKGHLAASGSTLWW